MSEGNQNQIQQLFKQKDKIFNVKKPHYKQFDYQKYSKIHFSPVKRENQHQLTSPTFSKKGQYNFQVAIISSDPYKQLNHQYKKIKQEYRLERQSRLALLKEKQEQLLKYQQERQRLETERSRLLEKRDQIRNSLDELRQQNQFFREQEGIQSTFLDNKGSSEEIFNIQYLKQMIISMRYQNGVDIDPDQMTYQQLIQLGEQIGNVSKGFSLQQINMIPKIQIVSQEKGQLCSICYEDVKVEEYVNKFQCLHAFHCECIKQWLLKERVCPMCKQQITLKPEQE